jgi:hypothetical protein
MRPPVDLPDFRIAVPPLQAGRALRVVWGKAKGTSPAAKLGLRYENRVAKQLERLRVEGRFKVLEHNPWFTFSDQFGTANCSPDFLLHAEDGKIVVVEVKLTWVEVAVHKLNDLYCPVISAALDALCFPLVIVRSTTPKAPPAALTLSSALKSPYRLLLWPDNGRIPW